MTEALSRVRLFLIGGAALIFLGGLLVAVGRWNRAETDRAFVEAAAQAARAAPPAGGVRYWAPGVSALPGPITRMQIEASERLRQAPSLPAQPAIQAPVLPPPALRMPRPGPLPADKPPAVPR